MDLKEYILPQNSMIGGWYIPEGICDDLITLFKQSEETKKLSTALKTAIEAGEYEKAANIKKLISGTKGGLSKMDMAAAVGIPLAMAGTAAYAGKTEGTDMGEMNKYLA